MALSWTPRPVRGSSNQENITAVFRLHCRLFAAQSEMDCFLHSFFFFSPAPWCSLTAAILSRSTDIRNIFWNVWLQTFCSLSLLPPWVLWCRCTFYPKFNPYFFSRLALLSMQRESESSHFLSFLTNFCLVYLPSRPVSVSTRERLGLIH